MTTEDLEKIQKELKWITIRNEQKHTFFEKLKAKGITGFLVPAGCAVTAGVLVRGLYFMLKKDGKQQQKMMRYRIGAQGITLALALVGILLVPSTKSE